MVAVNGIRVVAIALESCQQSIERSPIGCRLTKGESLQRAHIPFIVEVADLSWGQGHTSSYMTSVDHDMHALAHDLSDHIIIRMSRLFHFTRGGKNTCTPDWHCNGAHEPDHKVYIPISGSGFYDSGAGERELRPGTLYFIPGGRRHRYRCPEHFTVRWIHLHAVDHELNQRLSQLSDLSSWPTARWRHARSAWEGLDSFFASRDPALDLRLQALAAEIFSALMPTVSHVTDDEHLLRERLAPAATWLDENASRNPGLAVAAKKVNLSPVHFHRLATRAWGETPHARVQRVRLEYARALLRDHRDLSVAVIAQHCGFGNPFYLTRAFTQRFGMPPTVYRRRIMP